METRTGFIFYESYFMLMRALSPDECKSLLKLVCSYALYGEMPEKFDSELIEGMWFSFFPSLKKGRANSGNRQKQSECGKKETKQTEKPTEKKTSSPKAPEKPIKTLIEAPSDVAIEDDLTQANEETEKETAARKELEEMGVIVDCPVGDVEPELVKERFAESDFLRDTFKCLSKIKRHYDKIVAGCYKNVRAQPAPQSPEDDYMKHHYSAERLQAAVLHADDLDRFLEEREKYKNSRFAL